MSDRNRAIHRHPVHWLVDMRLRIISVMPMDVHGEAISLSVAVMEPDAMEPVKNPIQ